MLLEVDVSAYHDTELRHVSEIGSDEPSLPSHHGPSLRHVLVVREEPNVVRIGISEHDIELMERDHRAAVEQARKGYTAIHEGGAQHGQEVVVPPRNLPLKSRRQLLAEHLAGAVLPHHAPAEHVRAVRIVESTLDDNERALLERYLTRRLATETEEEE